MTKKELVDRLNTLLTGEYAHMLFYLHHAATVGGLHREEMREMFLEHAKSEMEHVHEFSRVIVGLGGDPRLSANMLEFFSHHTDPYDILNCAIQMEDEVVVNYSNLKLILDSTSFSTLEPEIISLSDRTYVSLFLEDQILDSRSDADEFRQMCIK